MAQKTKDGASKSAHKIKAARVMKFAGGVIAGQDTLALIKLVERLQVVST